MSSTSEPPRLPIVSDPAPPPGLSWHDIPLPSAPFKLARFTVAPGCVSPLDTHQVTEVWVVAHGTGELTYDGDQLVPLAEGDAVLLEPPRTHQVRNDGSETLVMLSIYWQAQR